jgi:hypothetical protein
VTGTGYVYSPTYGYWVYSYNATGVQVYVAGYYQLNFHAFADYNANASGGLYFTVNGGKRGARVYATKPYAQYEPGFHLSVITYLNANDVVTVVSDITLHGNDNCSFSGHMIA